MINTKLTNLLNELVQKTNFKNEAVITQFKNTEENIRKVAEDVVSEFKNFYKAPETEEKIVTKIVQNQDSLNPKFKKELVKNRVSKDKKIFNKPFSYLLIDEDIVELFTKILNDLFSVSFNKSLKTKYPNLNVKFVETEDYRGAFKVGKSGTSKEGKKISKQYNILSQKLAKKIISKDEFDKEVNRLTDVKEYTAVISVRNNFIKKSDSGFVIVHPNRVNYDKIITTIDHELVHYDQQSRNPQFLKQVLSSKYDSEVQQEIEKMIKDYVEKLNKKFGGEQTSYYKLDLHDYIKSVLYHNKPIELMPHIKTAVHDRMIKILKGQSPSNILNYKITQEDIKDIIIKNLKDSYKYLTPSNKKKALKYIYGYMVKELEDYKNQNSLPTKS